MATVLVVMNSIHAAMISWSFVIVFILIIVKIFQIIGGAIERNKAGSSEKTGSDDGDKDKEGVGPPKRKGNEPNRVLAFNGDHKGDRVILYWSENNKDENVNYYWIERRRHVRAGKHLWSASWNRNLWGNWKRVAYVNKAYSPDEPFIDSESYKNQEGIVREWWGSLDKISPEKDYEYRIRAVNSYGKGDWSGLRVSRPSRGEAGYWTPIIDGAHVDSATGNLMQEGHVEESHAPRT